MDVRLLEETCDPLHMPCVMKVEIMDTEDVDFHFDQQFHTTVDIKEEVIEEIPCEDLTSHDTDVQLDHMQVELSCHSDTSTVDLDPAETLTVNSTGNKQVLGDNSLTVNSVDTKQGLDVNSSPTVNSDDNKKTPDVNSGVTVNLKTDEDMNESSDDDNNQYDEATNRDSDATNSDSEPTNKATSNNKHVPPPDNKVKCKMCSSLMSKKSLPRHMKRMHQLKFMHCHHCSFSTKYKHALLKHICVKHIQKCGDKCKKCEKLPKFKSTYRPKIIRSIIYKCIHCKRTFKTAYNLQIHKCTNPKFTCILCQNKFINKNLLKNHVKEQHGNLKLNYNEFNQLFIQKIQINANKNNKLAITNKTHSLKKYIKCYICAKLLNVKCYSKHLSFHNRTLNCDHCNFKTKVKDELVSHMKKSHLKVETKCKICDFKGETKEHLENHIFYVHNGNTIGCKYCNYEAKHKYRLRVHMKSRHEIKKSTKNKKYKCNLCGKTVSNIKILEIHIKKHLKLENSSYNKIYTCKNCKKWYSNFKTYKLHIRHTCPNRKNIQEQFLYCDLCSYKAKKKWQLNLHMKCTHKFVNKMYSCKKCDRKFVFKHKLKTHARVHNRKSKNCEICASVLIDERSLENHMKNKHNILVDHPCSLCNDVFKSRFDLHRHKRAIHKNIKPKDPNARPYQCKYCVKNYKTMTHLKAHIIDQHTERKPVICEQCGKLYKNDFSLRQHKLTQHEIHNDNSVELFKCNFCDKKFIFKKLKIQHEVIKHKNMKIINKKYKTIFKPTKARSDGVTLDPDLIPELTCQFCGKIATSKCNLRAHIYTKHSDVKPFKCDFCEKAFKYRREVNMHRMTHTNERPFKCPSCDYATKFKQSLRTHIISKHVNK